jgi:phospholipase/carboxylesterase
MLQKKQSTFTWLDYNQSSGSDGPILVMLHGYGSNEKDLISLAPYLDRRLRIISLRAPLPLGEEMYGWFPIEFTPTGITVDRQTANRTTELLVAFLRDLIAENLPSGHKVFLMGFSQGAVMNYLTAFRAPELLHGIISLSGQLPDTRPEPGTLTPALKTLPFLVQHGLYDDVLPIEKGREAAEWLKSSVDDVVYREYPMAHQIDDDSLAFLADWLHKRVSMIAG